MDIYRNLILIKTTNKSNQTTWEDMTYKIKWCKYEDKICRVTFNSDKSYKYNKYKVQWLRNPEDIELDNKVIYAQGKALSGVVKAIRFEDYIRVIYRNGYSKIYAAYHLTLEKSCFEDKVSKNCFEYFKELANCIGINGDDGKSLIGNQYERLKYISPKSVLSYYLNPRKIKKRKNNEEIIFPFGFNLSQKEAVENAFESPVSIIEGPPGTGKTQTILNIIANAVYRGKTVAVVSNNNAATENVYEKIKKKNLDFICAPLGSNENKKKFFNNQRQYCDEICNWGLDNQDNDKFKDELIKAGTVLEKMLQNKNVVAKLRDKLAKLRVEYGHFKIEYVPDEKEKVNIKSLKRLSPDKLMGLLIDLQMGFEEGRKITLKNKIINLFRYRIFNFNIYNISLEQIMDAIYNQYYDTNIIELEKSIKYLDKRLKDYKFDVEMKRFSEKSLYLLQDNLHNKYNKSKKRITFKEDVLWKNLDKFIEEYPVILSTTHSIRNCISDNYLLDYLIIDESSQVDLLTGALALSCAKNAVIVGDLKQLTNVVSSEDVEVSRRIFNKYKLNEAYDFSSNNILLSLSKIGKDIPKILLREHYRCSPKIINYCNNKFYDGELIILTEDEDDKPLAVYKTNEGNHARGMMNERQIDVITEEVLPHLYSDNSIGIITPYRMQAENLSKVIDKKIKCDTVHKFQGREEDIIILSTVANEINNFIDDSSLINVAVSRAVKKLIVVTSDFENTNSNIGDLIKYIRYNNLDIIDSKVSSIFDLLYKSYNKTLYEILSKRKKISKYDSENLMYTLIKDVLKERYNTLDVVFQVPLGMIINNRNELSDKEKKFVLNPYTHIDFTIFNKMNKSVVLAVEVDGYNYHVNNKVQLERDRMKNEILTRYNIPLIRFKTNGSGEKEKLINKLEEII